MVEKSVPLGEDCYVVLRTYEHHDPEIELRVITAHGVTDVAISESTARDVLALFGEAFGPT